MKLRQFLRRFGPKVFVYRTVSGRLQALEVGRATHAQLNRWWDEVRSQRDKALRCAHSFGKKGLLVCEQCGASAAFVAVHIGRAAYARGEAVRA